MSRAISFSQTFPAYHPKAGQPTYFVEKILKSLDVGDANTIDEIFDKLLKSIQVCDSVSYRLASLITGKSLTHEPKYHTIRAGHRWKAGDWFKPVVWGDDINPKSGRSGPYHSKQIQFAPEIQIRKTWDFDIHGTDFYLDGRHEYALTGPGFDFEKVAMNDGLDPNDLFDWFQRSPKFQKEKEFFGQIICWNPNIEY